MTSNCPGIGKVWHARFRRATSQCNKVSTGSGSDRVSVAASAILVSLDTRSLPLPVLSSSCGDSRLNREETNQLINIRGDATGRQALQEHLSIHLRSQTWIQHG